MTEEERKDNRREKNRRKERLQYQVMNSNNLIMELGDGLGM